MTAPMLLEEFARLFALAAPSYETSVRREDGVAPLLELFAGRGLDGVSETDARMFAAQHPGASRYAKSMFKMAVDDGVIPKNPFRHIRAVAMKAPGRTPPPRDALWRAVELATPEAFRQLLIAAAASGLRVSELCKLEIRDVLEGEDGLRLHVRDGKGKNGRSVPRQALVLEPFGGSRGILSVLEARDAARERGPDVPGQAGDERRLWLRPAANWQRDAPWLDRGDVGRMWGKVRAQVGLEKCRFHDIRHFHATWLLDCGCTAEDVAIQLHGHPNPKTVIEVYGHPSHELARLRLRKLTRENGAGAAGTEAA